MAKWQRLDKYVGGVYAVKVVGVVSDFVLGDEMSLGGRVERIERACKKHDWRTKLTLM